MFMLLQIKTKNERCKCQAGKKTVIRVETENEEHNNSILKAKLQTRMEKTL